MVSLLFTSCMIVFYWTTQAAPSVPLQSGQQANRINNGRLLAPVPCNHGNNNNLPRCQPRKMDKKKLQTLTKKYNYMFTKVDPTSIDENGVIGSNPAEADSSSSVQIAVRSSEGSNPCNGGFMKAVISYAYDINNNLMELVRDDEQNLYQAFRVQRCNDNYAPGSYSCEPEDVLYKTLVYSSDSGIDTEARFVKIPAVCVLYT